jgi:hypothetical protein
MPDISLPEVRLKDKLPEGLRDMTMEDIQRAMPDVHLPRFDLGREARRVRKDAEKAVARAAKEAEKAAREAQKSATRSVERALPLPQRRGPNVVPVAILAMLGGLVVGWILANSPTAGPRISTWLDDLRARWDEWRGRGLGQLDESWQPEPQAFPESLRAPVESDRYTGPLTADDQGVGVGVGPGSGSSLPEGMGTDDPARVGADDRV